MRWHLWQQLQSNARIGQTAAPWRRCCTTHVMVAAQQRCLRIGTVAQRPPTTGCNSEESTHQQSEKRTGQRCKLCPGGRHRSLCVAALLRWNRVDTETKIEMRTKYEQVLAELCRRLLVMPSAPGWVVLAVSAVLLCGVCLHGGNDTEVIEFIMIDMMLTRLRFLISCQNVFHLPQLIN